MKEEVKTIMNKSDLRPGMVVELRMGEKFLVLNFDLAYPNSYEKRVRYVNLDGKSYISNSNIEDDLTVDGLKECYIMKVYSDYTLKELLWERKEIKLTEDEKAILRNIDKKYKYIARDKDGSLRVYTNKVEKSVNTSWWDLVRSDYKNLDIFRHLFQFIKWEDDEPCSIKELLANEA